MNGMVKNIYLSILTLIFFVTFSLLLTIQLSGVINTPHRAANHLIALGK